MGYLGVQLLASVLGVPSKYRESAHACCATEYRSGPACRSPMHASAHRSSCPAPAPRSRESSCPGPPGPHPAAGSGAAKFLFLFFGQGFRGLEVYKPPPCGSASMQAAAAPASRTKCRQGQQGLTQAGLARPGGQGQWGLSKGRCERRQRLHMQAQQGPRKGQQRTCEQRQV